MFKISRSVGGHLNVLRSQWTHTRYAATATATHKQLKTLKDLPGPFTVPLLGSGLSMIMNKNFDVNRLHKYWFHAAEKYGDMFYLDTFGMKVVVMSNPDHIQKVFEMTKDNPIRRGMESFKKVRYELGDNYLEGKGGIVLEDGEEWWRVRRRTQGPMMKPKLVKSYLNSHNQIALEFLDIIAGFQKKYGEMPADFQEEMYKWALESVALVALDKRFGCLDKNITRDSEPLQLIMNVNKLFKSSNDAEVGLRLWRFFETKELKDLRDSHEVLFRVADKNIRQAVDKLKTKIEDDEATLMQIFLQTPGLSYKDVTTMVMDMMFAGIDTTSHTLAFALYLLAKNPEKQKLLQKEVDEIFGDRQTFETSDFAKLSYVKAVIKETLRHYPIGIGNLRFFDEDVEIGGYSIPKGYGALMFNMIPSLDEKYFPRAKEFIPERWLRHRPLGPIHPYASLPFGTGTRMCIGRRIAEQEMYVFLVRVFQRFNVDYKYKDMDIHTKLVFAPSEPLKFNFTERK